MGGDRDSQSRAAVVGNCQDKLARDCQAAAAESHYGSIIRLFGRLREFSGPLAVRIGESLDAPGQSSIVDEDIDTIMRGEDGVGFGLAADCGDDGVVLCEELLEDVC